MDEPTRQYFDMMDSLFAQPGWKLLADDIQTWKSAIADGWRSYTPEQIRYEQGRYDGLSQVTDMFSQIETAKAAVLEDEAAALSTDSMGFGDV